MSSDIDPYRDWLGIKSAHRPPNHYELLDLKLYESDRERIENSEMIEMAKVLRHENGPHAALARQLCRELEQAIRCLLDPEAKAAYDAELFMMPRTPAQAAAAELQAHKVEETAQPNGADFDFSTDLKLTDHEPSEEALTGSTPSAPPEVKSSASAAPHKAAHRPPAVEEQEPHRPSLMQMLDEQDERAEEKDPKKRKQKEKEKAKAKKEEKTAKTKPAPKATPARAEKKKPKAKAGSQFSLPELSGKQLGVAAAIVAGLALVIGVGMLIYNLPPGQSKVLAMIGDVDPQVRIQGLSALRNVGMDTAEEAALLLKVLREEKEDDVRIAAVNALIDNGVSPSQTAEIKPLLAQEQNPTVKALLEWLVPAP